jgi:superfamily I DNA and RNA helicase
MIGEVDPEWWGLQDSKADDFWEFTVPLKFHDVLQNREGQFDAIIVDEGQDFRREWFEVLNCLLEDPKGGRFVVFYDDGQDIFNRWNDLPWGASGSARKHLKHNCRNTKSIVQLVKDHCDYEMESFERSPVGETPIVRVVENREIEQKRLVEDVSALLADGIRAEQLVFLLNEAKPNSCIAELNQIQGQRIKAIGRYFPDRNAELQYSNIRMFKGLESDVVFVLGLHDRTEAEIDAAVYTQGTRARTLLYVYRPKTSA